MPASRLKRTDYIGSRTPTTFSRPPKKRAKKLFSLKQDRTESDHQPTIQKDTSYSNYIPFLVIGAPFAFYTFFILTSVSPKAIQNVILENTYLPLLITFFGATFFIFSFICLKSRRGFLLASCTTLLLFLKLQGVIFEISWMLPFFGFFVIIEMFYSKSYIDTSKSQHANISKTSRSRYHKSD